MGVFKLDLMTLLVLFVVISVIFTMTSGAKEEKTTAPAATVEKPLVQGMNNTSGNAEFSTTNFQGVSPKINHSKFASKTWN